MIINHISENLSDPTHFSHSHASEVSGNIIITSGMVSRVDADTGLNIGVVEKDGKLEHDIDNQFDDIIKQLELLSKSIYSNNCDIREKIVETKVFIVDVKKYFKHFNASYKKWMQGKSQFPARTTIGVQDLPSNVVLEISFVLSAQ